MVSDPQENWGDSEETYQAFGSSELDGPERDSGGPPQSTEEKPVTPGKPRAWGSGSSLTPLSGDRQSVAADSGDLLFGKYRVLHKLGGGGMGDVWLVEHIGLGVNRALKIIKADIADENASNRLRFQQEAKILAQLSKHPNAVEVHDTGIVGDHAYIEMDYLEGQTLGQWLKSKPSDQLPLDDVLWFLRGLCNVLGEAHKLGIVHRDIKPGNIMIVPDPNTEVGSRGERVKVLDFGIAKIIREVEGDTGSMTMHTRGYLGTVPYSSPEQLGIDVDGRENVRVDHRSDIYSIGVLLYEMLAGIRPFTGNPTKILYDHVHTPPPPFAQRSPNVRVPRAVEKVVMRCLEKSPAKRPQSARELYELFRNAVPKSLPPQALPQPSEDENPSLFTKVKDTTGRLIDHVTSLLTKLGLPSNLPRKATLRLFFSLALVSGVVSGVVVLYFVPKRGLERSGVGPIVEPPQPPIVPEGVRGYLKSHDFQPADGAGIDKVGWPAKIERISVKGSRPMVLSGAFYFPEGYSPETDGANATGLPRVLVRDSDNTRFLLIKGDEFIIGAWDDQNPRFQEEEKKGHLARLSSYYMQQTEVTNKEIQAFSTDVGLDYQDIRIFWAAKDEIVQRHGEKAWEERPAVGISRELAERYAHRVGGELPTEQQWEFAARSRGQKQLYVWRGDEVRDTKGNYKAHVDSEALDNRFDTIPVLNPASPVFATDCTEQGIHGLAGNVREWCRDVWRIYGRTVPPDHVELPREGEPKRYVIRGGSFNTPRETLRVTWRTDISGQNSAPYKAEIDDAFKDVGFRVVLEVVEKRSRPEASLTSGSPREVSP